MYYSDEGPSETSVHSSQPHGVPICSTFTTVSLETPTQAMLVLTSFNTIHLLYMGFQRILDRKEDIKTIIDINN